ncbi:MAG: Wzz/FepE/Etk N-terminal domain-containing protein [Patescibacteria group bacterium]|jgi:capsular polysaccharide biosynthesis protein
MELREHISILKKSRVFIITFTLLVTLAAFLVTYLRPLSYASSISFAVNRINKQETPYYDDSYFGIQASDLFSQTVISWFLTPSVLLDIYERGNVDPQIESLEKFANRFKTKKYSPQNIVVRFNERDEDTANKISQAVVSVVEEKAVSINQTADNKALFEIVGEKPVIVKNDPQVLLTTIIGFIVGLGLSVVFVYLLRYFKTPSQPKQTI